MDTLHDKFAIIVTTSGAPVALGRFHRVVDAMTNQPTRLELVFETEAMACRLRVPQSKLAEIKATWNGDFYRYVLPTDNPWTSSHPGASGSA